MSNKTQPVEVEIVKIQQEPLKHPRQIVDVPYIKEKVPHKVPHYLGKTNQSVPKETIAPLIGKPENAPVLQKKKEVVERNSKNVSISKLATLIPRPGETHISMQDNLIREKVGPFTLISTTSSDLAPFVIAEGRRVLRVLQENIENYTWFYQDISTFKNNSIMKVIFDSYGKVKRTKFLMSSGSGKVDWVFYNSVRGGVISWNKRFKKSVTLVFVLGKNYLKIYVRE